MVLEGIVAVGVVPQRPKPLNPALASARLFLRIGQSGPARRACQISSMGIVHRAPSPSKTRSRKREAVRPRHSGVTRSLVEAFFHAYLPSGVSPYFEKTGRRFATA